MKFQDSSFNGLKVTVGTKSVTHPRTHAPSKSNMPHQLFQSWGHNQQKGRGSLSVRKLNLRSHETSVSIVTQAICTGIFKSIFEAVFGLTL